jgi:hypothetical protein
MAQVNSTFYDLVVPKLYETITITKNNEDILYYGTGSAQYHKWKCSGDENGIVKTHMVVPPEDSRTRKDQAIESCKRLIIDIPTQHPVNWIVYVINLYPSNFHRHVEELVLTRRALSVPGTDETTWCLHDIVPPIRERPAGRFLQCSAIKRVVLHLANDFGRDDMYLRHADRWSNWRRNDREQLEYGVCRYDLFKPQYHLDCHFHQYNDSPSEFLHYLTAWLLPFFGHPDLQEWPQFRLFNVYRFLMPDQDVLQDPALASQQASRMLKREMETFLPDLAAGVQAIAARVTFHNAEYEAEYPFSRPVPVSLLLYKRDG